MRPTTNTPGRDRPRVIVGTGGAAAGICGQVVRISVTASDGSVTGTRWSPVGPRFSADSGARWEHGHEGSAARPRAHAVGMRGIRDCSDAVAVAICSRAGSPDRTGP
jgi:hypothetical protein